MKFLHALPLLFSLPALADVDGAFLDQKYLHLKHPKVIERLNKSNGKNEVLSVIEKQSPVRSQMARGTCSIFSATAYLEGLLIKKGDFDSRLDLSEEWLQYTAVRGRGSDGSSAPTNFNAIAMHGMPLEETLPYIGEDWTEVFNPLKEERCGHLKDFVQKSCLIVHRDPSLIMLTDLQIKTLLKDEEFVSARKEAYDFRNKNIKFTSNFYYLNDTEEVKNLLDQGMPLIMEADFYYGAWNHRLAEELGIGRNMDHWSQGIVTFPEEGSMDLQESVKKPAGHSILIVGYDDNKIIKKTIKMADGKNKTFTYKGVYYFKNSWGANSFGVKTMIDGENHPGYGMIVQKYAHELGSFFIMPLK